VKEKNKTLPFLTFRIGREWYGIDVMIVVEVLQMVTLNLLPGEDTIGMMTLRDNVMPVIDLRQFFGSAEPVYTLETPIIAIKGEAGSVGLIVDEADDVAFIDSTTITPHNDNNISATARHDGKVLFILDADILIPANDHA